MYDLHDLGWHGFQQLCLTVLREILGQTVECFLDSADAGQDGAFTGTWTPSAGEDLSGRFVVQCKFTGSRNNTLKKSDLSGECEKARKLVQKGRCDCYILMTNAGIRGTALADIESLFRDAGVKHFRVLGSTWICQQIKENKRLRMLVPRIYGLGDLSQILDDRAYTQAKALLASLREDLAKVVLTDAYRKAADALDQHGFVLLVGAPAAGKTTIAAMLSMGALDQWGASTLKLSSPAMVVQRWNPDEPSQFFWIDDAFGVNQYESYLAHGWNHAIAEIRAMLRGGSKVVMTSRDYIYNRARNDLKEGAFPLLRESQVVVDVRNLSSEEKQQILYNHIKLGNQDKRFRRKIKVHLPAIAAHPRFVPETARRLAEPLFMSKVSLDRDSLLDFVDKQEQFLQEVIQGLDIDSRAALAVIYMRGGFLPSPVQLAPPEREALERLGSNLGSCLTALNALNGSLVQHAYDEGVAGWTFKHPTIGDAYAGVLLRNPELLSIYLRGSAIDTLLEQVTCGDVGIERAVVLPRSLFALVIERLAGATTSQNNRDISARWRITDRIHGFLARRCSKEFLTEYLQTHPETFDAVSEPGLYLSAVWEVDLAIRLHELLLLPEKNRKEFVTAVTNYAIEGEDLYALESDQVRALFTPEELASLDRRIRDEFLPKLADIRRARQRSFSDGDPRGFMESFLQSLSNLREKFSGEPSSIEAIDREIDLAEEWVAEKRNETPRAERTPRRFGDVESPFGPNTSSRSIFDDIDE